MNFLYVCTPSCPMGTIAQAGNAIPLSPPPAWAGEQVVGAWVETHDGQVAIRWGRVPARIAAGATLIEQASQGFGRMM